MVQQAPIHPTMPMTNMKTPSTIKMTVATFSVGFRSETPKSSNETDAGVEVIPEMWLSSDEDFPTRSNAELDNGSFCRPNFRNKPPPSNRGPISWTKCSLSINQLTN